MGTSVFDIKALSIVGSHFLLKIEDRNSDEGEDGSMPYQTTLISTFIDFNRIVYFYKEVRYSSSK